MLTKNGSCLSVLVQFAVPLTYANGALQLIRSTPESDIPIKMASHQTDGLVAQRDHTCGKFSQGNSPHASLQERRGVSHYRQLDCQCNSLFMLTLQNTPKLRIADPLLGESTWIPLTNFHNDAWLHWKYARKNWIGFGAALTILTPFWSQMTSWLFRGNFVRQLEGCRHLYPRLPRKYT